MATPHDELFKATFSQVEHARAELMCVLPEAITRCIDWSTLSLISGEFADPPFAHLYSDLLYTVQVGGSEACVYLLFEHQSTVDRSMALRLLRYMTRIWERFEKDRPGRLLPPILPVVLYHGDPGWTAATRFRELLDIPEGAEAAFQPFIPDFAFVVEDLSKVDDDALRARALTELARLTFVALQRCRGAADPVAVLRPWSQALVAVLTAPSGRDALLRLASYILGGK